MTAPAGTQAVVRALRLLKQLGAGRPRELTELAAAVSLSRSTTYRLLGALESEELAVYDPGSRTWSPGVATAALLGDRRRAVIGRCRPLLEGLVSRFDETATLEGLDGDTVVIVDEVQGPRLVTATPEVGTRWPLHATSSGKAILSQLPQDEVDRLLAERLPARAATARRVRASLRSELERFRRQGFATASGLLEEGYAAAAAAFEADGDRWAISVGGPVSRLGAPRLDEIGATIAALVTGLAD